MFSLFPNFTEDARLEAEIEAAKAASRKKAEMELKQQREREREAARAAIEKVYRFFQLPIICLHVSYFKSLSNLDALHSTPPRWKELL